MHARIGYTNHGGVAARSRTVARRELAVATLSSRFDLHPRELADLFPEAVGSKSGDPQTARVTMAEKLLSELREEGITVRAPDGRFRMVRR